MMCEPLWTLDDDVASLLRHEMQRSRIPFKSAVNHFLRLGLKQAAHPQKKNFTITPISLKIPCDLQFDSISELLEQLEGPEHK